MRWDPLLVRAFARELDARLHRARVRSLLLEPEDRRILLYLREHTLVLELHPEAGWISLLDPSEPPAEARPLASRVAEIRAIPDESALVIGLQRVRGKDEGVEVVAEFVGNRWNGVVVGYRSRRIRHVLVPRRERDRVLEVGQEYEPPPSTGRAGIDGGLDRDEWDAIVGRGEDRRTRLLRGIAWSSSLNAEHFLDGGWEAWRLAVGADSSGAYLVEGRRGVQPYPFAPGDEGAVEMPSLLDAMDRARREADAGPTHALLLSGALLDRAERHLRRLEGRTRGMARQLERAPEPEPIRALGDLILARYHLIPSGQEEVTLVDFEGNEVVVELDPALPPDRNAARYYDRAAKAERVRTDLPAQVEAARKETAAFRTLLEEVKEGTAPPEALSRVLGPPRVERKGRKSEGARLPYRRYRSSSGLEIRVGRGARANDDLTFRNSSPDDIWMHVREAPGAHVILRWGRKEHPPKRDLTEAAVLAALESDARGSGLVPVDWTRRKHVRKPRNAPPGAVIPDRVETLFVEPDPSLKDRLEP